MDSKRPSADSGQEPDEQPIEWERLARQRIARDLSRVADHELALPDRARKVAYAVDTDSADDQPADELVEYLSRVKIP